MGGAYDDRFRLGMESLRQDVAKDLGAAAARLRGASADVSLRGPAAVMVPALVAEAA
jgi:hypothetical protein